MHHDQVQAESIDPAVHGVPDSCRGLRPVKLFRVIAFPRSGKIKQQHRHLTLGCQTMQAPSEPAVVGPIKVVPEFLEAAFPFHEADIRILP